MYNVGAVYFASLVTCVQKIWHFELVICQYNYCYL